jgi:hypothetical protein
MQKIRPIRSKKLRQSAKGEDCTFQIPGVCNGNPETTGLCHLPDESHGMGRKSDDHCSAYGCSDCHDVIDGRVKFKPGDPKTFAVISVDKEFYMRRAMVRTQRRMIEKGLIVIK